MIFCGSPSVQSMENIVCCQITILFALTSIACTQQIVFRDLSSVLTIPSLLKTSAENRRKKKAEVTACNYANVPRNQRIVNRDPHNNQKIITEVESLSSNFCLLSFMCGRLLRWSGCCAFSRRTCLVYMSKKFEYNLNTISLRHSD